MTTGSSRSAWFRLMTVVILVLIASALTMSTYAMIAERIDPPGSSILNISGVGEDGDNETLLSVTTPPAVASTRQIPTRSRIDITDGYIPDDDVLSPFDVDHPAIGNLDPALVEAIQQATIDARTDGIEVVVNSGWRSERYQQALLDEAIVTYGSEEEARKWVNSPDQSTHVTGDGVDIGYTDADYWLIEHGYRYGLCQTYANEIWHFELAVAPGTPCPPPLTDANEQAS